MNSITQLTLNIFSNQAEDVSSRVRFPLEIEYMGDSLMTEQLTLPLKETVYLWAWLDAKHAYCRTNAKDLGRLKAARLAMALTGEQSLKFDSDFAAYQFFKHNIDPLYLKILMGNDCDETAIRLEKNSDGKIFGGYLGGESESKDKTRFKASLNKQLKNTQLVKLLLPEQVKNNRATRVPNRFELNIANYTIL